MATIEHHVRLQGFWADEGLRSRMPLHEYAERQAAGCPPMSGFAIWTSRCPSMMHAGWRLLLMGCHSMAALSWLSTPPLLSVLKGDGTVLGRGSQLDGVALRAARRRKERTYPELVRPGQKAKLVVLAGEVAGRWSEETASFLRHLARARARSEPPVLQKRAEQAWRLRWGSLLACEKRVSGGVDGDTPSVP